MSTDRQVVRVEGRGPVAMALALFLSRQGFDAASISITSTAPPSAISLQLAQTPHGVVVGPWTQLRQRATMRATVVLPVPRCPENI